MCAAKSRSTTSGSEAGAKSSLRGKSPRSKPVRTKSARKRVTRAAARDREGGPLLINRPKYVNQLSVDGFPLLSVKPAATGAFYAVDVEGVAIGGKVAWVKGVLLPPNADVPATPPRGAAEASVGDRNDFGTPYRFPFTEGSSGRRALASALGPVDPEGLVRLVTWVGFYPSRSATRKTLIVVLADRLQIVQPNPRICNIASWLNQPKGRSPVAVRKDSAGQVTCEVEATKPHRIAALNAFIYRRVELDAAKTAGPLQGNTKLVTPSSAIAKIEAPNAIAGNDNWLLVYAKIEGCDNFSMVSGTPLQLSVS